VDTAITKCQDWSKSVGTCERVGMWIGQDWIVQCFTSSPTQYRLYGRRFLQVKRPNQQYQSTESVSLGAETLGCVSMSSTQRL